MNCYSDIVYNMDFIWILLLLITHSSDLSNEASVHHIGISAVNQVSVKIK